LTVRHGTVLHNTGSYETRVAGEMDVIRTCAAPGRWSCTAVRTRRHPCTPSDGGDTGGRHRVVRRRWVSRWPPVCIQDSYNRTW